MPDLIANISVKELVINIAPLDAIEELKASWQTVEENANGSFFTSWHWIGPWLETLASRPSVIKITKKGRLIGIGILCQHQKTKYGITTQQLFLNRTGDSNNDQIWIEYNDLLCIKGEEEQVRAAVSQYFSTSLKYFDEFIVGVSSEQITDTKLPYNHFKEIIWSGKSYLATLDASYANWETYLHSLSANTRAQIRRSKRAYEQYGELTLSAANSEQQALTYFEEAGTYHKIRWQEGEYGSGFNNSCFLKFHRHLIQTQFKEGAIDILKISADNQPIAYLYNFIFKDTVYFYLSGINYFGDNKHKPGILAHSLAISFYANKGFACYDFMAGESRYKKSLSTSSSQMVIVCFSQKNIKNRVKHALKKSLQKLRVLKNIIIHR
ncbi:GNAT family N-acetyltransferase [Colwelliaceae bacterium 6471]